MPHERGPFSQMSSLRRAFKQHQPQEDGLGIEGAAIDAKRRSDAKAANRITWVGVGVNLVLAGFKLVAGIVGNSAVCRVASRRVVSCRVVWHRVVYG